MRFVERNINFSEPLQLSSWRRAAIATWRRASDPSIYGLIELEIEPVLTYLQKLNSKSKQRITLTHFFAKAIAEAFRRHPEINGVLRRGRIFPRTSIDICFQVAIDDIPTDLSGITLRNVESKTIPEIALEMEENLRQIRSKNDPDFQRMKKVMCCSPHFFLRLLLRFTEFLTYGLNLWSPYLGIPRDPFGSVIISNLGSLGLKTGFLPLVPYARVPILFGLGQVHEKPVAREGQMAIAKVVNLCATLDHRLVDGIHAARLDKTLTNIVANPEKELDQ